MKSQGSLEYLLILAAILAIAVVVVVVANSMLNPAQDATSVQDDKYLAAMAGYELHGYEKPINPPTTGYQKDCPESITRMANGESKLYTNPQASNSDAPVSNYENAENWIVTKLTEGTYIFYETGNDQVFFQKYHIETQALGCVYYY